MHYDYYYMFLSGNMRSSILDATKSKSIKQDHLKAYIRGSHMYIRGVTCT